MVGTALRDPSRAVRAVAVVCMGEKSATEARMLFCACGRAAEWTGIRGVLERGIITRQTISAM